MIFLFAPPCSGKSTILKTMEKRTNFSAYIFDSEIETLIETRKIKRGEIITDEFIDEAIKIYFHNLNKISTENLLCEIPYHNYKKLIMNYPIISNNEVITLYAPLKVLLERNSQRLKNQQIPNVYIERCLVSINSIKTYTNVKSFDTSKQSIDYIIKKIEAKND